MELNLFIYALSFQKEILKHVISVSSKDKVSFLKNDLVSGNVKKQALVKAHGEYLNLNISIKRKLAIGSYS